MADILHAPFSPLILETHLPEALTPPIIDAVAEFLADPEALAAHPETSPVLEAITQRAELPEEILYGPLDLAQHLQSMGNRYLQSALARMAPEDLHGVANVESLETFVQVAWVNDQGPGDFVPIHKHSADISGVLYLMVPEAREPAPAGRIAFFEGRSAAFVREKLVFEPAVGAAFLFPSWLNHMVYPFREPGRRWAVSFNLMVGVRG